MRDTEAGPSPLPAATARVIFCHVLSALHHAHHRGFLHCDIKPDNIRLNKACDHAVLTDWGYARLPGRRPEHYMCGTPAYLSPEIIQQKGAGKPLDWWTLGIFLHEVMAGTTPFESNDPMEM